MPSRCCPSMLHHAWHAIMLTWHANGVSPRQSIRSFSTVVASPCTCAKAPGQPQLLLPFALICVSSSNSNTPPPRDSCCRLCCDRWRQRPKLEMPGAMAHAADRAWSQLEELQPGRVRRRN